MVVLIMGCASGPALLPKNEINEPVHHTTQYTAVGAGLAPSLTRKPGSREYRDDFRFSFDLSMDRPVARWASYSFLPVYWNFLLTGQQYADSSTLSALKPAAALHGGLTGVAYSSRSGWATSAEMALDGKMVWNRNWFTDAEVGAEFPDLGSLDNALYHYSVGLGNQLSARNSLKLSYGYAYLAMGPDRSFEELGLDYVDRDDRSTVLLRHSYYAARNHVFGPEAGLVFRNFDSEQGQILWLGIHYTYRFH